MRQLDEERARVASLSNQLSTSQHRDQQYTTLLSTLTDSGHISAPISSLSTHDQQLPSSPSIPTSNTSALPTTVLSWHTPVDSREPKPAKKSMATPTMIVVPVVSSKSPIPIADNGNKKANKRVSSNRNSRSNQLQQHARSDSNKENVATNHTDDSATRIGWPSPLASALPLPLSSKATHTSAAGGSRSSWNGDHHYINDNADTSLKLSNVVSAASSTTPLSSSSERWRTHAAINRLLHNHRYAHIPIHSIPLRANNDMVYAYSDSSLLSSPLSERALTINSSIDAMGSSSPST
jgi:hypothetical protein